MGVIGHGEKRENAIKLLCDGVRTSHEIAAILGDNAKYVQRVMKKFDLPRLPQAPRTGKHNPSFVSGRKIDRDGYVLVTAPLGHPHARMRKGRKYGVMYEHRLLMEKKLERLLDPLEVVDHINGLRLHNCPLNLRLFDSNANHLRATISGRTPKWSEAGRGKQSLPPHSRASLPKIDTYERMKKSGDARLREIFRALIEFGQDSPFLLGSFHHLKKAGISDFSHSSLIRALDDLSQRYA